MDVLAVGITALVAMIITVLAGYWMIPLLRRLKFGQTILDIGPRWHKDKQGTPTMGGLFFIIGIVASSGIGYALLNISLSNDLTTFTAQNNNMLLTGTVLAFSFGLIGFFDDYIKVVKKQNLGLNEKQKLVLQFLMATLYIIVLYQTGERSTSVWIPFIGHLNLGYLYYPLVIGGIVFIVNVVNFTDGIDGLCSSVTLVSAIGFLIVSQLLSFAAMKVMSAALIGGCVGFLVWNIHPAKVFMGDTGSMFLGGMIVAIAMGLRLPTILIFNGFIFIIEGLSVIIQMSYFKYTKKKYGEGRRIFKMTPIHHHFEMSGWSENKIVIVFSLVQALFCAFAVLAINLI